MLIKILIVDDDLAVISSLGKIFTTAMKGYLVLTATSANEGYAMMKEQNPDIVIVDVRLGRESGMDIIAEHYKASESLMGGYRPIFIVITAYDDAATKKKAEEYKVEAFLLKPFAKEVILHAVIDALCKLHGNRLKTLESMRNHYKALLDKIKQADDKIGA